MAEFLRPDVYVQEVSAGARPIEGVSTSTGGFVITAPRGKVGVPQLVTSWTDFVNKFAYGLETPFRHGSYGAYSIFGFFNNGGTRAYVVRVGDGTESAASVNYTDGQSTPATILEVRALDEGSWGNDLTVRLNEGTDAGKFDFIVYYKGVEVSIYTDVTLAEGTADSIETAVNGIDRYVEVEIKGSGAIDATELNVDRNLTGGADGDTGLTDTHFAGNTGLGAFDAISGINLVVIPESQSQATIEAALSWCEKRMDAFFIADGGENDDVGSIQSLRASFAGKDGALYFPWIEVSDPIGIGANRTKFIPAAGHVAGMYARIDGSRGVAKAPAGLEAQLRGALSTKVQVVPGEQDILNPLGINVIRAFPNRGIVAWGARTMASDPKDRYINVRRELKKIMASLVEGSQWAVFEPNNENLWRQIRVQFNSFLMGEFRDGAFKGTTPAESFYVKCDGELNTPAEVDAGRVNIEVGVAINKPGEFVIIRIGQWEGGASASVA